MSDATPDPTPEQVDRARAAEHLVRQPHHDETTQREALENALQDEGASEAGPTVADDPS